MKNSNPIIFINNFTKIAGKMTVDMKSVGSHTCTRQLLNPKRSKIYFLTTVLNHFNLLQ